MAWMFVAAGSGRVKDELIPVELDKNEWVTSLALRANGAAFCAENLGLALRAKENPKLG